MKKCFISFFAAVLMIPSCVEGPECELKGNFDEEEVEAVVPQTQSLSISAGNLTKSSLGNDGNIWWEKGDKIAVVFPHPDPDKGHSVGNDFTAELEENTALRALFKGTFLTDVSRANGYDENAYAIYPNTAVDEKGQIVFELPSVQTAVAGGSFMSGYNITSAPLSLSYIEEYGNADTDFKNVLSYFRFTLDNAVKSVTFTGTTPLAGRAPLHINFSNDINDKDHGRLMIGGGEWINGSNSVTLMPEEGYDHFQSGGQTQYNLLVWPGIHDGLTITLDYGEPYGKFELSNTNKLTFKSNKYYNLNFKSDPNKIMEAVQEKIVITEGDLNEIKNDLSGLEGTVDSLLNQVQSISLMTEYLDNAAYAHYAQMTYSKQKLDVTLDYIVKPETAAEALVEAFEADPSVVSALLAYGEGSGMELQADPLVVKRLDLNEVSGIGKVVKATIDATNIDNKFYDGTWDAYVALQLANGKTDMTSDFAYLVPKAGSVITGNNSIPIVPGARVVIPFNYAVSGDDVSYTLKVDSQGVVGATESHYDNSKTGNLTVTFADVTSGTPSVTLTLTVGEGESQEVVEYDYTFVDNGDKIILSTNGDVDYIGGDAVVEVESTLGSGSLVQTGGTGVAFDNVKVFTFDENGGAKRTATVQFSVMVNSLTYYKDITLTQKAYGTTLSRKYYVNGEKVTLNQANASGCSNYFNIVILGDGYKKKDLAEGGLFERRARSAMDSFFGIEPYKTFKDRFNVYMVAYESADEGTDINSSSIVKNTYFGSYCEGGGKTAAYVADTAPVITAVNNAVGSGDATYYRSIAILLINTDEQAGSTGYPFRDFKDGLPNGYASFAIAVLAANSTGTNGLVKHEAGGHAFGRLADEYYDSGTTATSAKKDELSDWHAKGWYWNVNPNNTGNYYKFTNSAYGSSEVSYIEGAWGYNFGIYRPTSGGMMQGSTGVFNAPSRHAIYHRIITESEGQNAYSWSKFLDYDQKNR